MSASFEPRLNHFHLFRYDTTSHGISDGPPKSPATCPSHQRESADMEVTGPGAVQSSFPLKASQPAREVAQPSQTKPIETSDKVEISSVGKMLENLDATGEVRRNVWQRSRRPSMPACTRRPKSSKPLCQNYSTRLEPARTPDAPVGRQRIVGSLARVGYSIPLCARAGIARRGITVNQLAAVKVSASPVEKFEEFLRTKGMRLTAERSLIVSEVFAEHEHFDADQLVERLTQKRDRRRVSRSSVYRTLTLLEEAGLLRKWPAPTTATCTSTITATRSTTT